MAQNADAPKSQIYFPPGGVPKPLAVRGIDGTKFKSLVERGLVSSTILQGMANCQVTDGYSLSDKFLLADAVVEGTITEIEYLYKQGGPYRTLYTITIGKSWKGDFKNRVQILSPYGPNRRDHRRWKRDPIGIELEVGDKGLFIIDVSALRNGESYRPPEANAFLKDKGIFLGGTHGAYLIKNGDFDKEFLTASGKSNTKIQLTEAHSLMQSVSEILGRE